MPFIFSSWHGTTDHSHAAAGQSVGGNPIHSRPPTAARAPPDNALKAPQDLPKGFLQVNASLLSLIALQ